MSSPRIPALTVMSLLGLGVFGVRLITDPADWLPAALGVVACLVVLARTARVIRTDRQIASTPALREV